MEAMGDRESVTRPTTVLEIASASGVGLISRRVLGFLVDVAVIAGAVLALRSCLGARGIVLDDFWLGAAWLYFPLCEATWGRTPGKVVAGTRVVRADGEHPTTTQALGRAVCLPFDASIVFFLLVSVTRFRQRFGDLVARTYVIRNDAYRAMKAHEFVHGTKRTSPLMRGEP